MQILIFPLINRGVVKFWKMDTDEVFQFLNLHCMLFDVGEYTSRVIIHQELDKKLTHFQHQEGQDCLQHSLALETNDVRDKNIVNRYTLILEATDKYSQTERNAIQAIKDIHTKLLFHYWTHDRNARVSIDEATTVLRNATGIKHGKHKEETLHKIEWWAKLKDKKVCKITCIKFPLVLRFIFAYGTKI